MIHKQIELKVHQSVYQEIHRILSKRDACVPRLTQECNLQAELGFTSLELVKLIAALDAYFNVHLLVQDISIADLSTIGDLKRAYEKLLSDLRNPSTKGDDLLLATRRRAQRRGDRRDL